MIKLFLPYHSSGNQGAVIAALVPGINVVKVLLIGLGIVKDEATVKSMSRYGDYRFFEHCTYQLIHWTFPPSGNLGGLCNRSNGSFFVLEKNGQVGRICNTFCPKCDDFIHF